MFIIAPRTTGLAARSQYPRSSLRFTALVPSSCLNKSSSSSCYGFSLSSKQLCLSTLSSKQLCAMRFLRQHNPYNPHNEQHQYHQPQSYEHQQHVPPPPHSHSYPPPGTPPLPAAAGGGAGNPQFYPPPPHLEYSQQQYEQEYQQYSQARRGERARYAAEHLVNTPKTLLLDSLLLLALGGAMAGFTSLVDIVSAMTLFPLFMAALGAGPGLAFAALFMLTYHGLAIFICWMPIFFVGTRFASSASIGGIIAPYASPPPLVAKLVAVALVYMVSRIFTFLLFQVSGQDDIAIGGVPKFSYSFSSSVVSTDDDDDHEGRKQQEQQQQGGKVIPIRDGNQRKK